MLLFQLINACHVRSSTVLTSKKGFEEWGRVPADLVMAAALIDRLVHYCHIVNTSAATATGSLRTRTLDRPARTTRSGAAGGVRRARRDSAVGLAEPGAFDRAATRAAA